MLKKNQKKILKRDKQKTISDIEIVRSTGSKRIDKEVAKVIQKMPRWKPASENGSPIKSWYHLAIPLKKYGLEEKQEPQN